MHHKTVVMLLAALIAGPALQTASSEIKDVAQVAVMKGSAARYTPDGPSAIEVGNAHGKVLITKPG